MYIYIYIYNKGRDQNAFAKVVRKIMLFRKTDFVFYLHFRKHEKKSSRKFEPKHFRPTFCLNCIIFGLQYVLFDLTGVKATYCVQGKECNTLLQQLIMVARIRNLEKGKTESSPGNDSRIGETSGTLSTRRCGTKAGMGKVFHI